MSSFTSDDPLPHGRVRRDKIDEPLLWAVIRPSTISSYESHITENVDSVGNRK